MPLFGNKEVHDAVVMDQQEYLRNRGKSHSPGWRKIVDTLQRKGWCKPLLLL